MTYYYLNEHRNVLGPVSEEALKELKNAGTLADDSQICKKSTEAWLRYEEVFPDSADEPTASVATDQPQLSGEIAGKPPSIPSKDANSAAV